jgi:hypothetical protein
MPRGRRARPRTRLSLALALALAASSARAGDVSVQLDSGTGFNVKNASGAVERLRVDEATGNVSRNGALFVHTAGFNSLFVGPGAGNPVSAGQGNTAFGANALRADPGTFYNSALGVGALRFNSSGSFNSAVGGRALYVNSNGSNNSAFGMEALRSNTSGQWNVALGSRALRSNATGHENLAAGTFALYANTTGEQNTAFGTYALVSNSSGSRNVAIGRGAGQSQTTGSDNIYIANNGLTGESGQIRIGSNSTHTQAHIAGIFGATVASGAPVHVNAFGSLGTTTSSARFKQDVRDMGDASDVLMRMRPVTFRYLEEVAGAEDAKTTQYGLIAEEVAEVAPDLVLTDAQGRPYSVKYHELPALLLNEIQKQERVISALSARIEVLEATPGAACEAGVR